MAIPITIPRLGWNMEEGKFGGWLKNEGDEVQPGDRLFVLESEKAAEEIETLDGGLLHIPADGPKTGDALVVGTVIGYLVARGESIVVEKSVISNPEHIDVTSTIYSAQPSGAKSTKGPAISPRARRLASELGVDWTTIHGTGRGERIRERDVRAINPTPDPRLRSAEGETIPLTPVRRTIASRMLESQRATAPVTLTTSLDATNLVALRNQFKSTGGIVPSFTDIIVKLSALTLKEHLLLAGQWTDAGIHLPGAIHIGVAVDTPDGLRVPVIRDVPNLGLRDLARQSRDLIERARAGKLTAAEMQGGCFTVSNLGAYDIDAFTPIINYPECAVLGVGRIARRPAVVGDAIVPRDQVTLSLTFDHRIVDGAPAARFLQALAKAIENPGIQP